MKITCNSGLLFPVGASQSPILVASCPNSLLWIFILNAILKNIRIYFKNSKMLSLINFQNLTKVFYFL